MYFDLFPFNLVSVFYINYWQTPLFSLLFIVSHLFLIYNIIGFVCYCFHIFPPLKALKANCCLQPLLEVCCVTKHLVRTEEQFKEREQQLLSHTWLPGNHRPPLKWLIRSEIVQKFQLIKLYNLKGESTGCIIQVCLRVLTRPLNLINISG